MAKIYGQLCCDECDALVTDRDLARDPARRHLDGDVWETLCWSCAALVDAYDAVKDAEKAWQREEMRRRSEYRPSVPLILATYQLTGRRLDIEAEVAHG